MQYITSPELINFITGSLYPLTNISFPGGGLATTILLSLSSIYLSMYLSIYLDIDITHLVFSLSNHLLMDT